jgi:hypothetical protein
MPMNGRRDYVANSLVPMFYLFFQTYVYLDVTYVSHICCKCFIRMLCMFVMILKCFQVFSQVF